MIKNFKCKETEKIFTGRHSSRFQKSIHRVAMRKLTMIHGAATINFLRIPPANHLEKLSGDREGQWSIRINDQWRICFTWQDGDAYNVEIVDYH